MLACHLGGRVFVLGQSAELPFDKVLDVPFSTAWELGRLATGRWLTAPQADRLAVVRTDGAH